MKTQMLKALSLGAVISMLISPAGAYADFKTAEGLGAKENFNIDLAASWMVGDSESDIQAGKSAGCRTALLHGAEEFGQNLTCKSLLDFVSRILAEE